MRKLVYVGLAFFLAATMYFAGPKPQEDPKTFTGSISDSMCGLKHKIAGKTDKECTLECLKGGSKFVLADTAAGKVYQLSDQEKPKDFAGDKVKVTGTLKGDTIEVATIEAASTQAAQ